MRYLRVYLMLLLFCIGYFSAYSEGVRVAKYGQQNFFFDDTSFENELRSDPSGSDDNTTVFGTLTPLEFGLIYQLQLFMALTSLANLAPPSDIVKDDSIDITLETFDPGFQKLSYTYAFGSGLTAYEYDVDYQFGNSMDPYPTFRLQLDVVDPIKSASHSILNYDGGFGFRQYFTDFQNPEENKGATLFVGNVFLDDVAPPQHESSTSSNFKGVALNVDGFTGETLELNAYLSLSYVNELGLTFSDFRAYVDGDENAEGLTLEMTELTGSENIDFNFGTGVADEPVYQFRLTYSGGFSPHDFQFGVFTELDTDEDGMPDNYEDEFGLNKDVNDADEDFDGDGTTNFNEFAAGTAPNDANSVFKISISELGTVTATVEWTSIAGGIYIVESSTDLSKWSKHPGTPEITANQNTSMMSIELAPDESRQFFRVRKKDQ
jgi:hypothetical protein